MRNLRGGEAGALPRVAAGVEAEALLSLATARWLDHCKAPSAMASV